MGEIRAPRKWFLNSIALIYVCAFASIYVQIPGLYGDEGVLPVRLQMPNPQQPLLEQIKASPSLLWLAPSLSLEPQQLLEVLCLLGVTLSLASVLLAPLRDSLLYFCLWALYLSLYTVGGDFLHSEWDVLLLEAGFLAVLVAPLGLVRRHSSSSIHDSVSFWLTRWLLFRLTLSSGLSKLATGDPAWYGLSALSHHFDNQLSPSPLAWYVDQLPDWLLRLGAVVLLHSEICVPLLTFFAPIRRLRLFGFYVQLLLQLFHILTGNCSLLNLLTIALSFSLLDDEHFSKKKVEKKPKAWSQVLGSLLVLLVEMAAYMLIVFSAVMLYKLQIDWKNKTVSAKTDFTKEKFEAFVLHIQEPTIWVGVLSFTWEAVAAMLKCFCARSITRKLWSLIQWALITTAAMAILALSLVPYSTLPGMSTTILIPKVRDLHRAVEKYHLVGAYGVQHTMVSTGGRPEIILEGSSDGHMWTELNPIFKPGNVKTIPPIAGPHHPRLEWLMWRAAQEEQQHSPWFIGLVQRLLQGKPDVVELLQPDGAQYPFSQNAPALIRAKLYHYQLTNAVKDKTHLDAWWKRQYTKEFFPAVSLDDFKLKKLVDESGLKEFSTLQPSPETPISQALGLIRDPIKGLSGAMVIWTLSATLASIILLKTVFSRLTGGQKSRTADQKHRKAKEPCEAAEKPAANREKPVEKPAANREKPVTNREKPAANRAAKKDSNEKKVDSDRSPRKRK